MSIQLGVFSPVDIENDNIVLGSDDYVALNVLLESELTSSELAMVEFVWSFAIGKMFFLILDDGTDVRLLTEKVRLIINKYTASR